MKTPKKHQVRKKLVTRHGHPAMKRVLDTALIIATAPLTLPVAAGVTVLARIKPGEPALCKQDRLGLDENSSQLLRFRSISPEADSGERTLSIKERLTGFGRHSMPSTCRGSFLLVHPTKFGVQYTNHHSERCLR